MISARQRSSIAEARHSARRLSVCVVDPGVGDYADWPTVAQKHGVELTLVSSAEEALRADREQRFDFWFVSTALPGLPGADLCRMVKSRRPAAALAIVCDRYSPEAEIAARGAGATLFVCKPAHHDALAGWLTRARGVPTSRRASPC
jgi:DNA-binding response OmpR family regulator